MPVTEELNNFWSDDSIRTILSPSVFAQDTLLYAQELGYFKTFPPYSAARSQLDSHLILLTLKGEGCLTYHSVTNPLHPGDLFFIDCMTPHKYACMSQNWEFLWFHFGGKAARGYYALFAENYPDSIVHTDHTVPRYFLPDHAANAPGDLPAVSDPPSETMSPNHSPLLPARASLESLFREMVRINETPAPCNELLTSRLITEILTELLLQKYEIRTHAKSVPEFLKNVKSDIDRNFSDFLSLKDLAVKYNVDMYYLSKSFKKEYGINLKEYILTRRLAKAKDLLTYSPMSVAEIASAVGFGSTSHFISLFKQRENITPLMYRRLWKMNASL